GRAVAGVHTPLHVPSEHAVDDLIGLAVEHLPANADATVGDAPYQLTAELLDRAAQKQIGLGRFILREHQILGADRVEPSRAQRFQNVHAVFGTGEADLVG